MADDIVMPGVMLVGDEDPLRRDAGERALRLARGAGQGDLETAPPARPRREPELRQWDVPWYRALPHWIAEKLYTNPGPQQGADVQRWFGTENPLNIPGNIAEGADQVVEGVRRGDPGQTAGGLVQAGGNLLMARPAIRPAVTAVRDAPRAAAITAGGTAALAPTALANDDATAQPTALDRALSLFAGPDFRPPSREAFSASYARNNPPPRPPPNLDEYVAAAGASVRNSPSPPGAGPRAMEAAVRNAEARARQLYPSVMQSYEGQRRAWQGREDAAYAQIIKEAGDRARAHYDKPFAERNAGVAATAGYVLPAILAATTYGRMSARRARDISRLTDDISGGKLDATSQVAAERQLRTTMNDMPTGLLGDLAERARYAAPAVAMSGVVKGGEDIFDRTMLPEGSGARDRVAARYTDLDQIPGTIVDYGLRAGLPFAATGMAGLSSRTRVRPSETARARTALDAEGVERDARRIVERRAALRDIDRVDARNRGLHDEALQLDDAAQQQARVALEGLARDPALLEQARQRASGEIALRLARGWDERLPRLPPPDAPSPSQAPSPPPTYVPGSPTIRLAEEPQYMPQGISPQRPPLQLTSPPDGGPPVRPPPPPDRLPPPADPRQLSFDLDMGVLLREIAPAYRPLVATEFRKVALDPELRGRITADAFTDHLKNVFARERLPPIPDRELRERVLNLFDRARTADLTVQGIRPRPDGTPSRHMGQPRVYDELEPRLWDPRRTFGFVPAGAGIGIAGTAGLEDEW